MTVDLELEWKAALLDASIGESRAKLYLFPPGANLGGGRQAVYQCPGDAASLEPEQRFMEVLNDDLDVHRVGIASGLEPHIAAGVIRHELEHARQFDRFGRGIFRIQDLIGVACWEKTGFVPVGGGFLINIIPPELDANAAAARFAWLRHTEVLRAYMNEPDAGHQVLFRYQRGPEQIDTLVWRTLAYAATLAELCESVAVGRAGMSFGDFAEAQCPGAGAVWRQVHPR
jgi:hypothetical protein